MYAPLLCHFGKANPPKTVSGSSAQVITNNVYSIIKNKTRKQVTNPYYHSIYEKQCNQN